MEDDRQCKRVCFLLASTVALGIASMQLAEASNSPEPIVVSPLLRDGHLRLLKHHMSGPTLPPVMCNSDDVRTTTASCEALIGHTLIELQNLKQPMFKMPPVDPAAISNTRVRFEKRLAEYNKALWLLRARLKIAPPNRSDAPKF